MVPFVGRAEPLARLMATFDAVHSASTAWPALGLVTGDAGMGKSALLRRFGSAAARRGALVAWGTCWEGDQVPAWWPWTQVLSSLARDRAEVRLPPELAVLLPEHASGAAPVGTGDAGASGRMRLLDAVGRHLARLSTLQPLVVVLDDLHWCDPSSLELVRFLTRLQAPGALLILGAYRPREVGPASRTALAHLAASAELLPLAPLTDTDVAELLRATAGEELAGRWAASVHRRSGGVPFLARELCERLRADGEPADVPAAAGALISERLGTLGAECRRLLEVASVSGSLVRPDLLAEAVGADPVEYAGPVAEACAAGVLVPSGDGTATWAHDLYRETVLAGVPAARRVSLHAALASALDGRAARGAEVNPAEVALHCACAVRLVGPGPALRWARSAADRDARHYAFSEAAGHLARLREAVATTTDGWAAAELAGTLAAEADLRLRAGDARAARALLDRAWELANTVGDPDLLGAVALGLDACGARFAMPRAEMVTVLQRARAAIGDDDSPLLAQVTAALARQLQHSVPAERRRAGPLAEEAVRVARGGSDAGTLAGCLLALHDVLWTPGTAPRRAEIADEIAALARAAGDDERLAQALLLRANSELEQGSPAFRATMAEFAHVTAGLRQPRHDYVLRTRQAALALLDGDVESGERLSREAERLGEAVGDGDTGNVRMSQRLEIARARRDPDELRRVADEAVRWWVGAPAHAHAVAAGFRARAGDREAARREVDTVLALEDWRTDRSYLWSVFVGEMVAAATTLRDEGLCEELLEQLTPVAHTCAVNGAVVAFMGAHAHRVGLLHAALGHGEAARVWLERGLETHRVLGAAAWEAESRAALAAVALRAGTAAVAGRTAGVRPESGSVRTVPARDEVVLRRVGELWEVAYRGRSALLRDSKGLRDLATLLARPGVGVAAAELAGASDVPVQEQPVLDRRAVASYRARLAELEEPLTADDPDVRSKAAEERSEVLAELRRATRPGGRSRTLGSTDAERARKAVSARLRDAIRHIGAQLPELGRHLDRSVRTGTICVYDP